MRPPQKKQTGFSMIETMVALFILAVGILGLSALHATSLRGASSSHYRSQAVLLAYDMMDRMRSARTEALAGGYNIGIAADPGAGNAVPPVADDDLFDWFDVYLRILPSGDAIIACDNAGICTVTMQWDDSRAEPTDPRALTQQFSFTSEI